jgi:hypothetical protein
VVRHATKLGKHEVLVRRGGAFLVALAVVALAGAGVMGTFAVLDMMRPAATADGPALFDLAGNQVTFDPGEDLTPEVVEAQEATPDDGGRFIVDVAGLNVPLGAMNEVDNVITPPGFSSAYLIRNRGVGHGDPARLEAIAAAERVTVRFPGGSDRG